MKEGIFFSVQHGGRYASIGALNAVIHIGADRAIQHDYIDVLPPVSPLFDKILDLILDRRILFCAPH